MGPAGAPIVAALWSVALGVAASLGSAVSPLALFLLPLPLLVVAGRGREANVAVASLLAAATTLVLWGPLLALVYLTAIAVPAIAMTAALFRGFRIETVVAVAVTALAFGVALLFAASGTTIGEVRDGLLTGFDRSFAQVLDWYREVGVGASQLESLEANRVDIVRALVDMIPAIAVIVAGFVWLVNLWLSSWWLPWPQLRDLSRWQVPAHLIWAFIVSGFAMFTPVGVVARNLFAVMLAVYFLQGAAVVGYYLGRLRVPAPLRAVVLVLAALEQILAVFVLLLGIFDLWGDFRRLGRHGADALVESD